MFIAAIKAKKMVIASPIQWFWLLLVQCMMEKERVMSIPAAQRMERQVSLAKEHRDEYRAALERAVALDIPRAHSPSYGTFKDMEEGQNSSIPSDSS